MILLVHVLLHVVSSNLILTNPIHGNNDENLLQVLCVLLSVGGVTLVSFYSNSENNCSPAQNHTQNHTHINNASDISGHIVSHLNPKGVTCSPENSTPLGYIVSGSLSLSLKICIII